MCLFSTLGLWDVALVEQKQAVCVKIVMVHKTNYDKNYDYSAVMVCE